MFNKSYTKVKFQDQQLDDYVLENSVLKSKLQSKVDALSIMSKELDKCNMERDRYKLLVEQIKCKKNIPMKNNYDSNSSLYRFTPTSTISGSEMLANTHDHNNMLKLEVEMLRSKLDEATGDIIALRKQLHKNDIDLNQAHGVKMSDVFIYSNKDYEQLVHQLEKVQKKYQQIQLDYRATLDEKEELVSDRDYYKTKVQRLNHQISFMLSNKSQINQIDKYKDSPKLVVDIDALLTENKYLNERITQLQVEKEIMKRNLTKYKNLLENRNKNDFLHQKKGFADVMTQKQVKEFLDLNIRAGSKQGSAAELKSICLCLFEALSDKSIALQHQRKTNQILANRITELEKTLESWCNGQKYVPIFPSQMLLDEFIADSGSGHLENNNRCQDIASKEISSGSDDEINKDFSDQSSDSLRLNDPHKNELTKFPKTVLPQELENLVKEALAELKPI